MRYRNTSFLFRAVFLLALAMGLAFTAEGLAQTDQYKRSKVREKGKKEEGKKADQGDKLDITDLEQKYWAPKDTDFTVVQNRAYTKKNRYALDVLSGPVVNNTFSDGLNYELAGNYFWEERMGVGVSYVHSDLSNSKATDNFISGLSGGGVAPDFNRVTSYYGVSYHFVPFYAKMSVLGKRIIYFDMAISPGLGLTNYDQIAVTGNNSKSSLTYSLDVTQYFFFSTHFAFKMTLKNRWFKQDLVTYKTGTKLRDEMTNRSYFLLGATYFF